VDARLGNGDNVYVYRKRGETFDFSVPIPDKLDARVLEFKDRATIPHPSGLNWYHSHLHGISSTQVTGGLSGLLSVGDAKANVKAACKEDPETRSCTNPLEQDTWYLKEHTDVKYVLLRDISLKHATTHPTKANGTATATWAPEDQDWPSNDRCIDEDPTNHPDKPHEGYCQRADKGEAEDRLWLFTLNGQRFPKITIRKERNALLRVGNLSANVSYWLELKCEEGCEEPVAQDTRLEILSLDGVVPAQVVEPGDAEKPKANTFLVKDLLLMPAARAEIYIRNDQAHAKKITYILKSKKHTTGGTDVLPDIHLARIILEPNAVQSSITVALNAPIASAAPPLAVPFSAFVEPEDPEGCVRDLWPETDVAKREHRRVTFTGTPREWGVVTELVRFPEDRFGSDAPKCKATNGSEQTCLEEKAFVADEEQTIGTFDPDSGVIGVPFEAYDNGDGSVDWLGKKTWSGKKLRHPCIYLDGTGRSHKQLWVLVNNTGHLHNFHIHQMKFRLATISELHEYRIMPELPASTCPRKDCREPDYKLYNDVHNNRNTKEPDDKQWHDTMPIPPSMRVYIIMSFDAEEQLGRYVYHCHILKHEDRGLMVPIEVLNPNNVSVNR
jgi:FtsP/CotA-like multicopper oxidase with cupredoxin domain